MFVSSQTSLRNKLDSKNIVLLFPFIFFNLNHFPRHEMAWAYKVEFVMSTFHPSVFLSCVAFSFVYIKPVRAVTAPFGTGTCSLSIGKILEHFGQIGKISHVLIIVPLPKICWSSKCSFEYLRLFSPTLCPCRDSLIINCKLRVQ